MRFCDNLENWPKIRRYFRLPKEKSSSEAFQLRTQVILDNRCFILLLFRFFAPGTRNFITVKIKLLATIRKTVIERVFSKLSVGNLLLSKEVSKRTSSVKEDFRQPWP